MAYVRATCGDCRDVGIDSSDVAVVEIINRENDETKLAYSFICPCCDTRLLRPIDEIQAKCLEFAGSKTTEIRLNTEDFDNFDFSDPVHLEFLNLIFDTKKVTVNSPQDSSFADEILDALKPRSNGRTPFEESLGDLLRTATNPGPRKTPPSIGREITKN